MIGNAILLLVGVRSLRRYAPLALVLVPGLLLTGSRGAVVATAVGLAVILALQRSRARAIFTRLASDQRSRVRRFHVSARLAAEIA